MRNQISIFIISLCISLVVVLGHPPSNTNTFEIRYITQLQFILCSNNDLSDDNQRSVPVTNDNVENAIAAILDVTKRENVVSTILGLSDNTGINAEAVLGFCPPTHESWSALVRVWNHVGEDGEIGSVSMTHSVGDVTSAQIDIVNGESFEKTVMKELITATNSEDIISDSSIFVEGLGYKVLWLNQEDGSIAGQDSETQGTSSSHEDVFTLGAVEVYWPWWSWLIYCLLTLFIIFPLTFLHFVTRSGWQKS